MAYAFGSKVTVFEHHEGVLWREDREAALLIRRKLQRTLGVELYQCILCRACLCG